MRMSMSGMSVVSRSVRHHCVVLVVMIMMMIMMIMVMLLFRYYLATNEPNYCEGNEIDEDRPDSHDVRRWHASA